MLSEYNTYFLLLEICVGMENPAQHSTTFLHLFIVWMYMPVSESALAF